MPRTKVIDDDMLFRLIDRFLQTECRNDPRKLKLPKITEYVKRSGYPTYAVESLRRNKAAREYIDSLKAMPEDKALIQITSYKTLDVNQFLLVNTTTAKLKQALTELDFSYKCIVDSAKDICSRMDDISRRNTTIETEANELKLQNSELMGTITALKKELQDLKHMNATLRSIINDYVYPDIANELLAKSGILKNVKGCVDSEKLEAKIITGSTPISTEESKKEKYKTKSGSNIITGLFDSFAEDDEYI